jgi:hypothetical protein
MSARGQDEEPHSGFISGERELFRSSGHPEASGMDVILEYPSSWRRMHPKRAGMVMKVAREPREGENFTALCGMNIQRLGRKYTDAEAELFMADQEFLNEVSEPARLISYEATKIDGHPAVLMRLHFQMEQSTIRSQSLVDNYVLYADGHLVILGCSVTMLNATPVDEIVAQMVNFAPLFRLIANSIVVR